MELDAIRAAVRAQPPLVQCITNYVSMDITANVLNAAGASPAMVHDVEEAGEFAALASAVVINIGTPSPPWVDGMRAAARSAADAGTPWVLDPVAVGATSYRRRIVDELLALRPTVVRGNASEIATLATAVAGGRGVDSVLTPAEVLEPARGLARELGAAVAVTGPEDFVTDGRRTVLVGGGDPRMPLITALGCALSGLTGAFLAVEDDPVRATAAALATMADAGRAAGVQAGGPGSLRWALLDQMADDSRRSLDTLVRAG